MEYINRSKICREFLNQYDESLYPDLIPKLIKTGIYSLHKAFHKWHFSFQEIDEFLNYFNYKNRNFELESKYQNGNGYQKCEEYLKPEGSKIQSLKMGYRPMEGNQEIENGAPDCQGYGRFYPNDEVYVNEKNNFYDENYYIPRTRSFRNIQLYHKRLQNPKFITQEKKIYPHWWWNLKDDIEQDDYSDNDSDMDHRPSRLGRFPKNLEDKMKKKYKRAKRNQSFNGIIPNISPYYDEEKIFPNQNLNTSNNNPNNPPYSKLDYSPSDDDRSPPYQGGMLEKLPYPKLDNNYDNNNNTNYYNNDINTLNANHSPLYQISPNLNYRPPDNLNNRPNFGGKGLDNTNGMNKIYDTPNNKNNPLLNASKRTDKNSIPMNSSLFRSTLKSQILNKRSLKQSTFLSYDKDFKLNGAMKKVRGQLKKGLKYSLSGNQLKEDTKGIWRRKK